MSQKCPTWKKQMENWQNKYEQLKKYLLSLGYEVPLDIEPYTDQERESRDRLPEIFWTKRNYWDLNGCNNGKC